MRPKTKCASVHVVDEQVAHGSRVVVVVVGSGMGSLPRACVVERRKPVQHSRFPLPQGRLE